MFKRVTPYMGEYMKYTKRATVLMLLGIIFSIIPYFIFYLLSINDTFDCK